MNRVLVVEDDPELARTLRINLSARGYDVAVAATGAHALELAEAEPVDLVVLDLGLPDMDGSTVIHRIRVTSRVPIVVLSARDAQDDKVLALDAGADDYLTKPFGMSELLARIRAALRRAEPTAESTIVEASTFRLDLAAKRAHGPAGEVRLTPTEWHVLEMLVRNPGTLVSRKELLAEVWGPAYLRETNYLRVYLAQLRRKLEADPAHPRHLITEPGLGYRFDP